MQLGDAGYLELNGQQILANTGLSATLIRIRDGHGELTNEYTLAIRSTEFRPFAKGGDGERDTDAADANEIVNHGFAFAQLDALEHYYEWLKVSGKLPIGAADFKLNVTGYSLGGHLATVFTEIHQGDMKDGQTVTFNGAGRGEINNGTLAEMLSYFRQVLADYETAPDAHPDDATAVRLRAAAAAIPKNQPFDPLNIYKDAREAWAVYATSIKYGTASGGLPQGRVDTTADQVITQVWGKEIPNNLNMTANSGIHGPDLGVFIESQPVLEGWPGFLPLGSGDFGNGHAIVLLADSLALMRTMQKLVPTATIDDLTKNLFPLSTNTKSSTAVVGSPRSGEYEYNALENVLDGLRRFFLGRAIDKTEYTKGGSGFADVEKRQQFHLNVAELANSAAFQAAQGKISLTSGIPDAGRAKTDFGQFLSLYYLTPFSLSVSDAAVEASLLTAQGQIGSDWAHDKALSADDRAAGKAVYSDQYLNDRRLMAFYKQKYNKKDIDYSMAIATEFDSVEMKSVPIIHELFTDQSQASIDSEAAVIDTSGSGNEDNDRQYYFGSEVADPAFSGGALNDHLYGMGGNDTLKGEAGKDWIEGGNGNDELHGGKDADTVWGGAGNDSLFGDDGIDFLYGGDDDDFLAGGAENDWLEGGSGFDVYQFKAGDGQDVIVDAGGAGRIEVDADGSVSILNGGQGKPSSGQWKQIIGGHTYTYGFDPDNAGVGNLSIRRDDGTLSITVRDFSNGQLGITLSDLPVPQITPPANVGASGSEYAYQPVSFDANAGRDVIITKAGADTIDGGADDDYIAITAGSKTVAGGDGNDWLESGTYGIPNAPLGTLQSPTGWQQGWADWRIVDTGAGLTQHWTRDQTNLLTGTTVAHYDLTWRSRIIYDITSSDPRGWSASVNSAFTDDLTLIGGVGNDTVVASDGNDHLRGDDGDDILYGNSGNDTLLGGIGDDTQFAGSDDDVANGGDGNDFVNGADGNDSLYGGRGADTILGDGVEESIANRADFIDGGDGDDLIDAGGGNDTVMGGAGNDVLFSSSIANPDGLEFNLVDGGDGADTIIGSAGSDTLIGGLGNDVISGSGGAQATGGDDDFIYGGAGDDQIVADGGNDVVDGGEGNDSLFGDNGIYDVALHGNDILYGKGGNDQLQGYGGNDSLFGNDGNDTILGDNGNDSLIGDLGNDALQGDSGNDTLNGGDGIDALMGGDGNDLLYGDAGDDGFTGTGNTKQLNGGLLYGGNGNDTIYGGEGQDALAGNAGNDLLYGDDGDDQVEGGDGDDSLQGGSGLDVLAGGAGNDTYLLTGGGYDTIIDGDGYDTLILENTSVDSVRILQFGSRMQINVGQEALVVIEGGFTGAIDRFKFGQTNVFLEDLQPQNITPQALRSTYQIQASTSGEAPIVTASEPDPNDLDLRSLLKLSTDGFKIDGGANKDTLYGGNGADTISTFGNDDVVYTAGGNDVINAGDGNDYIDGEEGNDSLTGGNGIDTLIGGSGNDALYGGGGNDVYEFSSGFGKDVIDEPQSAYVRSNDTVNFANLTSLDVSSVSRFGLDAVIAFSNGDELTIKYFFFNSSTANFNLRFADGVAWGVEEMKQRAVLVATEGDDSLSGWETNDLIDAKGGNDNVQGGDGNDTLFGGQGADTIDGGAGDDLLVGDPDNYSARDIIFGNTGNDTIIAGDGDDYLYGGSGDDTYVYHAGEIADTIYAPNDQGNNTIVIQGAVSNVQFARSSSDRKDLFVTVYDANNSPKNIVLDDVFGNGSLGAYSVQLQPSGTTYSWSDIQHLMLISSEEDNSLWGTNNAESFYGAGGNDDLHGWDGDDTLAGNKGLDTLEGGLGNDVYLVESGQGRDVLTEEGGNDTIRLGSGITPEQLVLQRVGNALYLASQDGLLQIRVTNHYQLENSLRIGAIENIEFANGTVWDLNQIDSKALVTTADTLTGTAVNK